MSRYFPGLASLTYTGTPPVDDSPLTISALFYPDSVNLWRPIISIGYSSGTAYGYTMYSNSQLLKAYTRQNGTVGVAQSDGSTPIVINTWFHGCAVFASDTSRAAYLNGGEKGTNATSVNPNPALINRVGIAQLGGAGGSKFEGRIAEIGIYNDSLLDDEVAMLGKFVSPLKVRPQNLVLYKRFVRDEDIDLIGGLSFTIQGTGITIAAHPRVFYIPPVKPVTTPAGIEVKFGPRLQVI